MNVSKAEFGNMKPLGRIMAASFQTAFADFVSQQTVLTEYLNRIGNQSVFLWAFKENKRARRFDEKHGYRWDGSERVSEFDGALEVRYVMGQR